MRKPKKLILCIVGLPGSGKTTVAKMIKRRFTACSFETGDVIREEIKRRGLRYTKENDAKVSLWFHAGRERLIISRIINKIEACGKNIVVVTGFLAPEEVKMMDIAGKIILIAVTASSRVRYRREILRRRFQNQNIGYLRERDKREIKEGLGKLLKIADYTLSSESGKQILEKKADALVGKILEKEGMKNI